jgi:hypothetical protein
LKMKMAARSERVSNLCVRYAAIDTASDQLYEEQCY